MLELKPAPKEWKGIKVDDYLNRLTEDQEAQVIAHCKEHELYPSICAWYDDLDDFYEDWNDIGYSRKQADKLLSKNDGNQFVFFPSGEIIRITT